MFLKRIVITLAASAMLLSFITGCGGGQGAAAPEQKTEAQAPVEEEKAEVSYTTADIYEKISAEVELNSPMVLDDEFIYNLYGIDTAEMEDYIFSISELATSAETIAIIKLSDGMDAAACREALTNVKDFKGDEMRDYLPEQYEIVEKGVIEEKNGFLYLVISENSDAIIEIINNME